MDNNQLPEDWASYFGLSEQPFDLPMFDDGPEAYTASSQAPQLSDDPFQLIASDFASIPGLELEPGVDTAQLQQKDQSFLVTHQTAREFSSRLNEITEKLEKLDEKVSYLVTVGEKCLESQESESSRVQNSIQDVKSVIGNLVNSIVNDLLPSPHDEVGEAQDGQERFRAS